MNVLYDFFLTPQPRGSNRTKCHARLVVRDTIALENIAETIESGSSLRQSDVIGFFTESANVLEQELSNGNSIYVPGVGSFRIKVESPKVCSPKEIRAENIHYGRIVSTPEKDLPRELKTTTFEKVNETHKSQELNDIEIDGRPVEFLKDNSCAIAQQLCSLRGLRKAIVLRKLQKRVDEGKLTHPGYTRSPFYFSVPGWFGASRNR